MTGTFTLTLDTHAPVVTWGAVGGTVAGELLQAAYTIDEPAIQSATLRLPDARELAMTIHPDRVETLLPPDTPSGRGTITVVATDDLANSASYELPVDLLGALGAPPPSLGGTVGVPPTAGPPPRRRQQRRSLARARSRGLVTARVEARVAAVAGSGHRTTRRAAPLRSEIVARARGHVAVESSSTALAAASTRATTRRRDGQRAEEELLFLGLI